MRTIDMVQIGQYYDIRVALERAAIEETQVQRNRNAIEVLAEKWDPQRQLFGVEITEQLKHEEEMFHIELAQASRNEVLVNYLADVNNHIRAVRRLGWPDSASVDDTYAEHYLICQLMLERKTKRAIDEMINHIRKSQDLSSRITLKQIYSQKSSVRFV